jgi:hypothetical protein
MIGTLGGFVREIRDKLVGVGAPIPVDVGEAVINITGDVTVSNEVEVTNEDGNPIPVSDGGGSLTVDGPLTDAQLRAASVPVTGPITDTQLRATAVPVSAASLPLPSGAATEAKQDTLIGHVDGVEGLLTTIDVDTGAIDGKLPSGLTVTSTRLLVDGSGVTQPVSGTVNTLTGLSIPPHDKAVLDPPAQPTTVTYYLDDVFVAQVGLSYDEGDNLQEVTVTYVDPEA